MLDHKDEAVERMGCPDLYLEIARSLLEALPSIESTLNEAIRAGAWNDARRLAHSLKSNCATIGAENLRKDAQRLEQACAQGDGHDAGRLMERISLSLRGLRDEILSL